MKKLVSVLLTLAVAVSLLVVPAMVGANPGPILGFWQPNVPVGGTVQYSQATFKSPSWSVYLEALKASSPNDSNEIYVGAPTGVTTLSSLNNVSFWYYAPTGSDPVPPQIDVWLDLDGTYSNGPPPTGDEEWLLGQFPVVTTFDTWVVVPHSAITWIRGMGGTIYGTGSTGLTNASAETVTTNVIYTGTPVYSTLGDCPVLAIGIQAGSSATRATSRSGDQKFYVDDLTINAITYDLGPTSGVSLMTQIPSIVAISVTPTGIDFGTLYPGQTSATTALTVENIGTVKVDVDASVAPGGTVFDNLLVAGNAVPTTGLIADLASGANVTPVNAQLVVPSNYSPQGAETATLIFEATAA